MEEKVSSFKERFQKFILDNKEEVMGVYDSKNDLEVEKASVDSYNDGIEDGYQAGYVDGIKHFYDKFYENFKKKSYSEMEVYEVLDVISDTLDDLETEVGEC